MYNVHGPVGFGVPSEDLPYPRDKKFEVADCKRGCCEIVTSNTTAKGIVKVTAKGVVNLRCKKYHSENKSGENRNMWSLSTMQRMRALSL